MPHEPPPDDKPLYPMTLAEAQADLEAHIDEGTICLCCKRHNKRYNRPMYSTQAFQLITLLRLTCQQPGVTWFHIHDIQGLSGGGDFAKLLHWGLVEEQPKDEEKDTRTSGMWRITQQGIDFCRLRVMVPSHIRLRNGVLEEVNGELVDIRHSLEREYKYSEVMDWDREPRDE